MLNREFESHLPYHCYYVIVYSCAECSRQFIKRQSHAAHVRHCKLKKIGLTCFDLLSPDARQKVVAHGLASKKSQPICKQCGVNVVNKRCSFCSSSCSATFNNKRRKHSEFTKDKIRRSRQRNPLTGKAVCLICGVAFMRRLAATKTCSRKCGGVLANNTTPFCNRKFSKPLGGARFGSGRGFKHGFYKGIYCGSSYELIFLSFHLHFGHNVYRCVDERSYVYCGKVRKYHPDFVVDSVVYEVKGRLRDEDGAKILQNSDVVLVPKPEILRMRDLVPDLAGKSSEELAALYDDYDPSPDSTCRYCHSMFKKKERTQGIYCTQRCAGLYRSSVKAKTCFIQSSTP